MTSKLIPPDPSSVTIIRSLTPNITICSAPFARFGRFKVGGRGTIVRLQSGRLAIFSPTALSPEVQTTISSLGNRVSYLCATDYEHHIFISEWARAFPEAKLLGVEGLPEKRSQNEETREHSKFHHVWTSANKAGTSSAISVDEEFDAEFDVEYVGAHKNKELVFCHRPSRTLIEADLMFNLPATEQYSRTKEGANGGILNRMFTGLMSAEGTAKWQKRFLWYAASSGDREGFNKSVRRIENWDFDRIVPCHGDVIESGGKEVFRKVMEWHLKAKMG